MGLNSTAKEGGRFMTTTENQIERDLIAALEDLKYTYRPDIRDRAALEANFREKFQALNRVRLTDSEFQRLLDSVITSDVYNAAQTLRNINSFERDDGTPLNYTLVNIRDWCKNDFEVVNQLRISTDFFAHQSRAERQQALRQHPRLPAAAEAGGRSHCALFRREDRQPTDALGEDVRFKNHGLAPKSAADFAFLLHGFHFLKQDGVMAIILPHGVLFRGGAEARIRTKLLKDGHIDTVIGLPANLFFSTGIPVCILVLKKCKKPDDVLFINAAEHYEKGKRQNQLLPEHIDKIIDTYQFRKEEHRYARRVSMEEIEKNDFNLNISRYVSTAEAEEEIDVAAVHSELVLLDQKIKTATERHNEFLKELGLPLLPYGTSMTLPK